MSRPFPDADYRSRQSAARTALRARGLDALLIFAQESHYYLTGYDGGGYVYFQCALLTAEETPIVLLCRRPDAAQARDTALIDEIRIWENAEDANPAEDLREILEQRGLRHGRVGIETDNYGLTGFNHALVQTAMEGFCDLQDASDLVRGLRLVKSDAECALIRKAAELADASVEAVLQRARPGVPDSHLTAAAMAAALEGGGDMPPAGPLVNSGRRSLYGRGVGGARELQAVDQVVVELAATWRRYNCCIERTVFIGSPPAPQQALFERAHDTLLAMLELFRPGNRLGDIDVRHRELLDAAGHETHRFAACGYSLGATYRPSWMDVPPMIYAGNPLVLEAGMVFFPHVVLADRDQGLGVGVGETVIVTERGCERLSRLPLRLDPVL